MAGRPVNGLPALSIKSADGKANCMNRIFQFLCLVFILTGVCAAAVPESFIPAQAGIVVRLDANRLLKMGVLEKVAEKSPQIQEVNFLLDKLYQKEGIAVTDIASGQLWLAIVAVPEKKTMQYIYMSTELPESVFASLFQRGMVSMEMQQNMQIKTINGHTVYIYNSTSYDSTERCMAMTYLADDVIMIAESPDALAAAITDSLKGGNDLDDMVDHTTLGAMAIDQKSVPTQINNAKNIIAAFELSGNEKVEEAQLQIKLICTNKATAQMNSIQLKIMLKALLQAVFSNDTALAQTMNKALTVKVQGCDVLVNYQLDRAAIDQAGQYLKQPENQAIFKKMFPKTGKKPL